VGLLSWRQAQRIGALCGSLWYHVVRIRRRTVLDNLALALPERAADHRAIARAAYRHFGISALEFLQLKKMSTEDFSERVQAHGMEHYEAALARGRGVIVVTAHFGNFDLLAGSQAARGIPLAIVSRDLHQGGISRFWMAMRRAQGLQIFPDAGAARQVVDWLRRGRVLGLTVDQRTPPQQGGIRADFLGREVWTTTAPAVLATRTGAALLPVRIERGPDGGHHLYVQPEIEQPEIKGKNVEKDELIESLTRRINSVVGDWVRARPDQWMWLHRRFRDSGESEA
jgi:KDO2-lipid IV(A) lauroyltransferase